MAKYNVWTIHTLGESQFLRDSACDFGSSGVTVEIHLVHAVPVHMCPAQLQTMDGCRVAGREEKGESTEGQRNARGREAKLENGQREKGKGARTERVGIAYYELRAEEERLRTP